MSRRLPDVAVFVAYAAVSFAYSGWRLVPHPGRLVAAASPDFQTFVWSFGWWPHAIGSWTNPFVTHALYAGNGINLTWTATSPGLALVFSPLTAAFGPVVSYNVATLLLPALAAWTAFLLCRHLTRSVWASLVGGYLFGFATSLLGQQLAGHPHVAAVFLLPLIALVVVRYVEGELTGSGVAWRLALLLAAQLWISTEFAFTATLMLVLALALAFWLLPEARGPLRASLRSLAAAYAIGAVLAAPFLYYALRGFHSGRIINLQGSGGADLLNLLVPTQTTAIGGSSLTSVSSHFASATASVYLGLPTLLIVALLALRARHSNTARFLLAALGLTVLVVLGRSLLVAGHDVIPLPWRAASSLPLLDNVVPVRLSAYVALAAAVIVAVWTATTRGRVYARPYLLPVLALAAIVPNVWRVAYPSFRPSHPDRVAFFTHGDYMTCIPRGGTVVLFPLGNEIDALLWQAEAGFWFRIAGGGLTPSPQDSSSKPLMSFDAEPFVREADANYARPTMDRVLAFAAYHGAVRILTDPRYGYPSAAQMRKLGPTELDGGLLVAPACGQPSLAARNLASAAASYDYELHHDRSNIGWCTGGNYHPIRTGLYPAGALAGATIAIVVQGHGITCSEPPPGYKRHGFATPDMGVPANTYPLYVPS